jgi:hypothetical protein
VPRSFVHGIVALQQSVGDLDLAFQLYNFLRLLTNPPLKRSNHGTLRNGRRLFAGRNLDSHSRRLLGAQVRDPFPEVLVAIQPGRRNPRCLGNRLEIDWSAFLA